MKCGKCGAVVPDDATSCRECGAALVAAPPQPNTKKGLMYGIAALAAIAIIALVIAVLAMGNKPPTAAVSPDATAAKPVTTAATPAPPPAPVTQAHTPMVQQAPVKQKPGVPPEVIDYLEYVRQIEARRQALLRDQAKALALASTGQVDSIGQLFDMAMEPDSNNQEMPDPFKPVREELSRQVTNWQELIRMFDAKQPVPQPCAQFAGAYRWALASETAAINKVTIVMANVSESSKESMTAAITQLQAMRKDPQLQGNIDRAVTTADASLAHLCKYYEIPKPFNVPKEDPGGSLIGF